MNQFHDKSLLQKYVLRSVQIHLLSREELNPSLEMVHFIELISNPATHSNNDSIYTPIGAGLMVDFTADDFEITFIALLVLSTIFLAVLLKVFKDNFYIVTSLTSQAQCMKWLTFFVPESGLLLLVGLLVSHVAWGVDSIVLALDNLSFLERYHIKLVL